MENASKALIIAGAILLSILIIGLGMFIYQQAADAMDVGAVKSAEVDAYNSKFLNYKGIITGSQAKQLVSTVTAHNRTTAEDESQFVTVMMSDASGVDKSQANSGETVANFNSTINTTTSTIRAGKSYAVSYGYDKTSGRIVAIGLTEQT